MIYAKSNCSICGRSVSRNGLGAWNHGMRHVRRGEAKREQTSAGVRFVPVPHLIQLTLDDALAALASKAN